MVGRGLQLLGTPGAKETAHKILNTNQEPRNNRLKTHYVRDQDQNLNSTHHTPSSHNIFSSRNSVVKWGLQLLGTPGG